MSPLLPLLCCLSFVVVGCGGTSSNDSGPLPSDAGNDGGNDAAIIENDAAVAADVGPHDAGPTDQCTNATDMPIAVMDSTGNAVAGCGQSSLGAEPTLMNCITTMTGLSGACAACYDGEVHCVIDHCLGSGCAANPGGASCTACRLSMCHPAFMTCSGLT